MEKDKLRERLLLEKEMVEIEKMKVWEKIELEKEQDKGAH